jgi:hypothetical protein
MESQLVHRPHLPYHIKKSQIPGEDSPVICEEMLTIRSAPPMDDPDSKALFTPDGGSRHISLKELPSDKEADCSGSYVVPIHFHSSEREKRGYYVCLYECSDGISLVR